MSSFAVRFSVETPVSCARSGASIYTGFCLNSPELKLIVSEEIYNHDFKRSHPQIKKTLTITRKIIRNFSNIGKTLPVGYIIGKPITPLPGETLRFQCTDYILTPLNTNLKYELSTPQDKAKYDKANLSKQILGKFIGGAPLNGSKLERDTIASLGAGKICLIVCGDKIGEQKASYISSSAAAEEIGVFVE